MDKLKDLRNLIPEDIRIKGIVDEIVFRELKDGGDIGLAHLKTYKNVPIIFSGVFVAVILKNKVELHPVSNIENYTFSGMSAEAFIHNSMKQIQVTDKEFDKNLLDRAKQFIEGDGLEVR